MTIPWRNSRGKSLTLAERTWLKDAAACVQDEGVIVNIGVLYCASMYCLRAGAPKVRLVGIDIEPSSDPIHPELQAELIIEDSRTCHADFRSPIDLLFLDGDHHYAVVKEDIGNWVPKLVPGGVVVFHDYAPLPAALVKNPQLEGVRRAVNEWYALTRWRRLKAPDSIAAFQRPK